MSSAASASAPAASAAAAAAQKEKLEQQQKEFDRKEREVRLCARLSSRTHFQNVKGKKQTKKNQKNQTTSIHAYTCIHSWHHPSSFTTEPIT